MSQSLLPVRASGPENTCASVVKAAHVIDEGCVSLAAPLIDKAGED